MRWIESVEWSCPTVMRQTLCVDDADDSKNPSLEHEKKARTRSILRRVSYWRHDVCKRDSVGSRANTAWTGQR